MEWLMGKARGVGKGLMSTNNNPNSDQILNAPVNLSPASSLYVLPNKTDIDNKLSGSPSKITDIIGLRGGSPATRFSPPFHSNAHRSVSPSDNTTENIPNFLNMFYVKQQLPLSMGNAYTVDFPRLAQPYDKINVNEWLASNTLNLFDNVSIIFDAFFELCTCSSLHCITNRSGQMITSSDLNLYQQLKHSIANLPDEEKGKKTKTSVNNLPARQAIDIAMSHCYSVLQSPRIFPVRDGMEFPADLPTRIAAVCKTMLVCISHLYLAHFHHIEQLDLISHLNTLMKHFTSFTLHFSILTEKDFEALGGLHKLILETAAPEFPVIQSRSSGSEEKLQNDKETIMAKQSA